jgi:dihydrofolate synthase/folylpolyglutamate synthase
MEKKNATYQAAVEYLYEHLPMFQRVGAEAYKKNLDNILTLCKHLEYPQAKFPSIHIAGTNGKGSVSHMLSALMQTKGKKVGLYTSPHYRDYRERIKINGQPITEDAVVNFVGQHKQLIERVKPSFFEITVAMAFDYFAKQQVDIAIIETGLGGRLDSTNIVTPILSIITNISFDHQNLLGDTLALIAAEKAGIIKRNIPVVIGESLPETRPIFEREATERKAPIFFARDTYTARPITKALTHAIYNIYKNKLLLYRDFECDLAGIFQSENVSTVMQALDVLRGLGYAFSEGEVRTAFGMVRKLTNMVGRCQVISERPTVLCDSGHNEAGIQLMMRHISEFDQFKNKHFVIGSVKDKDLSKILPLYPKAASYYFVKPDIPRGLEAEELREQAAQHGLQGDSYPSVKAALEAAKRKADRRDLIFVGGSTFVVAEVI